MEYYVVEKKNNLGEQYIELSVFQSITTHEMSKINDHNQVVIDLNICIDYGLNVGKVVNQIQSEIINTIDRYIGFRNVKVNINVNKIKF